MEVTLGPFTFSSKFECGNLAKVVAGNAEITTEGSSPSTSKLKKNVAAGMSNLPSGPIDYEFNLWSQPDCAGTEFENNNRTWFFFSIQGGVPGQHVKLTIMNLNRQMKLFSQGMLPVFQISNSNSPHSKWERIKNKCNYRAEDGCTIISWIHTVPCDSVWTFYAFTYPYLYTEAQLFLDNLAQTCSLSKNPIYYHRDLLIESLDGNRLDMITITSQKGKREQREDSLPSLFPEWTSTRCHLFDGKKFIVMSARVHPGETSSSFVMKGFINFIVSDDPRAIRLRDMFVFKLIPMINPDGVVRGHYRSDQKGINLNRVYAKPSLHVHPTIYAIRQIIRYYHVGANLSLFLEASTKEQEISSEEKMPFRAPVLDEDACHSFSDAVGKKAMITSVPQTLAKPGSMMESDEPSASGWDVSSNVSTESFPISCIQHPPHSAEIQDDFSNMSSMSEHGTGVTNMFNSLSPLRDFNSVDSSPQSSYQTDSSHLGIMLNPRLSSTPKMDSLALGKGASLKSKFSSPKSCSSKNTFDEDSSLYLYVDLHGHASKRGIFIFGNWFPDTKAMVENMLFPKLLSLNCQNFDFSACNFSEKNMYGKDRKDGTSKEGSGRVAVMKATGIIRSYTLECNYNTGRTCNLLPASPMSSRKSPSVVSTPPKYTPYVFEDCGKQMGVSLLDLINFNDWSRIPQSQFGNLDGVRSYLHQMVLSSQSSHGNLPSQPPISGVSSSPNKDLSLQSSPSTSSAKGSVKASSSPRPKLGRVKTRQRGRSLSWSLSVDAENLEPPSEVQRPASSKNTLTASDSKAQGRLKSAPAKKSVSRALTFTEIESSRYPCVDKFTDTQSLSSSVTITPSLTVELTVPEEGIPKKKIQKPIKQRRKPGSVSTKKLKTASSSASEADLYKMADDIVALSANPLSPRSPLASVCEPQGSQSTSKLPKAKTSKKKVLQSHSKVIGKSEKKSLNKSIDKLPNVPMTHKVRILQRKSKKAEDDTSQQSTTPVEQLDEPLDWFIQQTFPKSKKSKRGKLRKQL